MKLYGLTNFLEIKNNCVNSTDVREMKQEEPARQIRVFSHSSSLRINSHINVNLIIAVYEHKHPFVALVLCTTCY
jgi:hypothetical protein